jgi:hypothetical protein
MPPTNPVLDAMATAAVADGFEDVWGETHREVGHVPLAAAPVAQAVAQPGGRRAMVVRVLRWAENNQALAIALLAAGLFLWWAGALTGIVKQTTGVDLPPPPTTITAHADVDMEPITDGLTTLTASINGLIVVLDARAKAAEATASSTLETLAAIEDSLEDMQENGIKRRRR